MPAIIQWRQYRTARHGNPVIAIFAPRRQGDPVGCYLAVELERKSALPPASQRRCNNSLAIFQLRIGCQSPDKGRAIANALRIHGGFCARPALRDTPCKNAATLYTGLRYDQRRRAAKARIIGIQINRETLPPAARRKRDGSLYSAADKRELARYSAICKLQIASQFGFGNGQPLD